MAARLVFLETDRELPSLNRGWRTPDPSPTREAAGLPGWDLKLCIQETWSMGDNSSRGRSTVPTDWSSRTPSPSPTQQWLPPIAAKVCGHAMDDQIPTPRMQPLALSFPHSSESKAVEAQAPPKPSEEPRPQKAPKAQKAKQKETSLARTTGENGKSKASEAPVECLPTVSMGSVGHPLTCAEPCKYVMKKNRGCKDGAACNRCHLCEWKKRGPRKAKDAPSVPSDPSSAQLVAASAQPEQC